MLRFMPKSTATTCRCGPRGGLGAGSKRVPCPSVQVPASVLVTRRARSSPSIEGTFRARSTRASALASPVETTPRSAPCSLRRRVSILVSTPSMPTTPARSRYAPSGSADRKLDGTRQASRTTKASTQGRADSSSSGVTP